MTSSSGEDPSAALVALGGVCRQRLCPGRSLHTHTRMHAHPGAWQGSRMCLGRVSCPLELCRKDWDTLRSLRVPLHLKGSSPSASAARSAFLAAPGQRCPGPAPRRGFLCIPSASGDAGNLPPLHHCHSRTARPRHTPLTRAAPAVLTPLHLTPIFFCLLFSLSVTHGCFCSAPRRHRERAQLPLL